MANIKVIIDRVDQEKSRTCFWRISVEEGKFKEHHLEFISITDTLNSYFSFSSSKEEKGFGSFFLPDLFNIEETQVIVLNWDCINTDPVYGSDRAFQFFRHYYQSINDWVKDGGVFIVESQATHWKPVQDAYRIFDEDIQVTSEVKKIGLFAEPNRDLNPQHPVLKNFDEQEVIIFPITGKCVDIPWFPRKSTNPSAQANLNYRDKKKLFVGWFEHYPENRWVPLLYSESETYGRKPIMLSKIVERSEMDPQGGAFILTTMYLGILGDHKLISNLFALNNELPEYLRQIGSVVIIEPEIIEVPDYPKGSDRWLL